MPDTTTRRKFLKQLLGGTAVLALSPLLLPTTDSINTAVQPAKLNSPPGGDPSGFIDLNDFDSSASVPDYTCECGEIATFRFFARPQPPLCRRCLDEKLRRVAGGNRRRNV